MPQVKTQTPQREQIGNYIREKNRSLFGSGYRWYDVNLPVGRRYVGLDKEIRVGDWILKPNGTKVSVSARGLAPTNTSRVNKVSVNGTNTVKSNTQTNTTNSGSDITYDAGWLPEVTVIGPKQKTRRANSFRRNTKNITFSLPTNNDGITLQEASIDNSPVSVIPSINIPETIEVPQVNTPGNFSRRDIRNLLRSKGIDPYYEIGGLQRRALRRYLNGEPVSGEYQDFINKIMQ